MPIHGYPGNVITANPVAPTSTVATGVWTMEQQLLARSAGNWPFTIPTQQISRSLRFNSADTAYLNRTLTTPTSGQKWTYSTWVKRGILTAGTGTAQMLLSAGSATGFFRFSTTDTLISGWTGASNLETTSVYRDPAAWYHIMLVVDTTQATAANRVKYYVNGVQITAFATTDYPTQNSTTVINSAVAHNIGAYQSSSQYFNGYMTEINFVDGQALTPSSFGQTNASTGVWEPINYTGTYGTNGFYLNFSDNSNTTAATLGKDYSGNGNNWTPNNFSVTAGAGNDSLVDSPTSYGTDTGVGGEVRGNYCTLNPLAKGADASLSNGNLDVVGSGTGGVYATVRSTIQLPTSGKWYCEFRINAIASGNPGTGILADGVSLTAYTSSEGVLLIRPKGADNDYPYWVVDTTDASVRINTTAVTAGNIFQVIYDADNLKVWMGINNTYYGISGGSTVTVSGTDIANGTNPAYTLSSTKRYYFGGYVDQSTDGFSANFGQRAFAYTAPSGFKALCTQNLPTPTIGATSTTQANDYFNVVLYTGTNGVSGSVTGVGFQPDFVWGKRRGTGSHGLFDSVRGVQKWLASDLTNAEATSSTYLTSFNSDGFSYGTSSLLSEGNIVAWNWKANGAGSSNTAGTITSTVSANTTSGFSIVTYTGTGANATVGHGLGVAPSMVIVKNRTDGTRDWLVYHASVGNTAAVFLNLTNASTTNSAYWNNTSPTSSVFSLGNSSAGNGSTNNLVAYCFVPVAGYSAFGSYTGNGSTDGPFVYLGFRPRFLLLKISSTTGDWAIYDTSRNTYNVMDLYLYPNSSAAEGGSGTTRVDALSNGFKLRNSGQDNTSSATYIYAAFAESPFKYSLAR